MIDKETTSAISDAYEMLYEGLVVLAGNVDFLAAENGLQACLLNELLDAAMHKREPDWQRVTELKNTLSEIAAKQGSHFAATRTFVRPFGEENA